MTEEFSTRETDAQRLAREVMGWEIGDDGLYTERASNGRIYAGRHWKEWRPFGNTRDERELLEAVRSEWGDFADAWLVFVEEYKAIIEQRAQSWGISYDLTDGLVAISAVLDMHETGDYAKAALRMVEHVNRR